MIPPQPYPAPASPQSTMGSVRSLSVLTVNSQWGWCFLSMRKELRHFLLFKQGPFFFQRTGKATRDSHSASNMPSTPILGTNKLEWRKKKYGTSCFFWYPCFFPTCMFVVSILSALCLDSNTFTYYFHASSVLLRPYAMKNFTYPNRHSQSTLKGYQQDDTKPADKKQRSRPPHRSPAVTNSRCSPWEHSPSSFH